MIFCLLLALGGCESIGYYTHVAGGQLRLLAARESVTEVIATLEKGDSDAVHPGLKSRLEESQRVLVFAADTLGLQVNGRYSSYVDLDREAVVWNLFAAPGLSLDAFQWCYPFVGCAPYRGYFDEQRVERKRQRMADEGFDTYVGGVTAYSTLGWFDDPLLSTFIDLPEAEFVELLFHELAHSRVWVPDDATFNESFASFVGRQGLKAWLESEGRSEEFDAYLVRQHGWQTARRLLEQTRDALAPVYADPVLDAAGKQRLKQQLLSAAAACLEARAVSTGLEGYRQLAGRLNNAYLASLATYSDAQAAFAVLFHEEQGDWQRFYKRVEALGALADEPRALALGALGQQQVAANGNDDRTDQIQCEALSRHGLDGEASGTEHDHVGRGGDR